nr:hypothetical protein [Tanacetum cinerariifolium]
MLAGIKLESDADSEGEVVSADDVIPVAVSISTGPVTAAAAVFVSTGLVAAAAADSPQSETEFAFMGLSTEELMSKIENEIANQAKWNNSGRNLYKLIDSSMSVRTKRGLGLDKYIGEGELVNLHLIKDCDFHEQRFAKRNGEGKGILKSRPTGKPVNPNRPKSVSAGRPNPVSAGRPNPISAGPLNIQSKSTYFHSFTHNNQQIFFPITHNSLYSLYLTGRLNGKTAVKPSAGWPWTKYGMSKTKGSKINGGSKSKSWSFAKGPLDRPKSEMTWVPKKD